MMEFPLRGFELMNLVVRCCNIFTDTLNTNVIIGKASLFFLPILVIRRVISLNLNAFCHFQDNNPKKVHHYNQLEFDSVIQA